MNFVLQIFLQQVFLIALCMIIWTLIKANLGNQFGWLLAAFWLICTVSLVASTTKHHFFRRTEGFVPVALNTDGDANRRVQDQVGGTDQSDGRLFEQAFKPTNKLPVLFGKKHTEFFDAQVIEVLSGDTVVVNSIDDEQLTVRLAAIDAPEENQPFAEAAREILADFVGDEHILVLQTEIGQESDQIFGWIIKGELNINEYLVQRGYAWYDFRQLEDQRVADLQNRARSKRLNVWSVPNPVPPWDWKSELVPGT